MRLLSSHQPALTRGDSMATLQCRMEQRQRNQRELKPVRLHALRTGQQARVEVEAPNLTPQRRELDPPAIDRVETYDACESEVKEP